MRKTFQSQMRAYLEAIAPYYAEGTRARIARNLRVVERDLQNVNEPHYLATAPRQVSEEHLAGLQTVWNARGLDPATQKKYRNDLNGMLLWLGNSVIKQAEQMRHVRWPKAADPDPESLDEEDLAQLRATAAGWEGWRGAVARLLVVLLPNTGLRPKEVRLAKLADVNLRRSRIRVTSPKVTEAGGSKSRYVPLPTAARTALTDFLAEREGYLGNGGNSEWLIPLRIVVRGPSGKWDAEVLGPWSDTVLRKLKADLQERSGVRFTGWKVMRSTFGQRLVDRGMPLEQTSLAMRHKKVETTRRYYVVLDQERALAGAIKALDDSDPVREE